MRSSYSLPRRLRAWATCRLKHERAAHRTAVAAQLRRVNNVIELPARSSRKPTSSTQDPPPVLPTTAEGQASGGTRAE
jgi:hypothetical protein